MNISAATGGFFGPSNPCGGCGFACKLNSNGKGDKQYGYRKQVNT